MATKKRICIAVLLSTVGRCGAFRSAVLAQLYCPSNLIRLANSFQPNSASNILVGTLANLLTASSRLRIVVHSRPVREMGLAAHFDNQWIKAIISLDD